jgi:homoserine/homoserine lactone efflux protein
MTGTDHLLIAFAITELVACLTPGPAVLSVVGIALTRSLRGTIGAIAGINVSNLIWYAMVGAGLTALVHNAPMLFVALRWAGIAYLFWLGVQSWRHSSTLVVGENRPAMGMWKGFTSGIALQLTNPKALVFFTVFLPPFIDVDHAVAPQIVILATIGAVMEIMALAFYAAVAFRVGRLAFSPAAERRVAHISGTILMALAVSMALAQIL